MRNQRQRQYLEAMGITLWAPRGALPGAGAASASAATAESRPPAREPILDAPVEPAPALPLHDVPATQALERPAEVGDVGSLDWQTLHARVAACTRCAQLAENRRQTVFGVGNPQADWMIIGEAPGAEEDKRGEPFVGRSGKLLDAMLAAIALDRGAVYIANILKCHPPNNRDPKTGEADNCRAYLERQIELVAPRLVLVVGRIAAQNLLQTNAPLGTLRGQVHRLPGHDIPVVVTYHPAHLLRTPGDKRKAWEDLKLACQAAAPPSS